ncbi:MAG: divergent polysaccharide deacetylase family protein [Alcanivoracaceae bacterium]|jgi:polysaccharide deacetylase 2 family uncharacterized protein YibQ|nr:divergent polysaccharide deacetylase family protein [Alcanivoracaceae bacterium]
MLKALLFSLLLVPALAQAQARIAIIIDDIGYHRLRGEAVAELPGAITYAVIPQTPHGPALARLARDNGKEIILHMPMATDGFTALDAGGLHQDMSEDDFFATIDEAVQRIPQAIGMNNHMGGVLTADETAMNQLMAGLGKHGLFFVDSRTTPLSVAGKKARQHGLAHAGRDIFLDNQRDLAAINTQFNRAISIARRRGHAIVIGHPYPETIEYLQNILPLLEVAGIQLVPVSQLLNHPQIAKAKEKPDQTDPAL